ELVVTAREGDPAPLGGFLGSIQPWPTFSNSRMTLGALTPDAPGGIQDAQILVELGPDAPIPWHPDDDGDGHGAPSPAEPARVRPEGWVRAGDDCNEGNAAVHPGSVEVCNGLDDDCDGTVDGPACAPLAGIAPADGTEVQPDTPPPAFLWRGGAFRGYRV